jgi:hypothetical protein
VLATHQRLNLALGRGTTINCPAVISGRAVQSAAMATPMQSHQYTAVNLVAAD